MKKFYVLTLATLFFTALTQAQSRVFKQVAEEISSDMETITQDGAVVGYVALTRLEKFKEDSFNYKLSLMDENLNDIGEIHLKDISMSLMGVAFDQEILCLSYLKSSLDGNAYKNKKAFRQAKEDGKNIISNQFVTLEGKIINTHNFSINADVDHSYGKGGKFVASTALKNHGQIKNIPGKGFCFLYGDKDKSEIIAYNHEGNVRWKKNIDRYVNYSLVPTSTVMYVMGKKEANVYGGFELDRFAVEDGKKATKYSLQDVDGNEFKVLNFEMNAVTGKPFIAGSIIKKKYKAAFESGSSYSKGMFAGVFSLTLDGMNKGDIKENLSYWSDGMLKPQITRRGYLKESKSYPVLRTASQDSAGNVYFAGTSLKSKTKIGTLVLSTLLLPTIIMPPAILLIGGTQKYCFDDGIVLMQKNKGQLNVEQSLEKSRSTYYHGRVPFFDYQSPNEYYNLYNPSAKSDVIIYRDSKSYNIYNINNKKVTRKIPNKVGTSTLRVFGAKEGHIMIVENNRKEKYTQLSIETI